MSLEEQFAAFNDQVDFRQREVAEATVSEQAPTGLSALPELLAALPELEVAPEEQPPVAPEADAAAPQSVEDEQTESLLADLDRATESLLGFRQEIGRLVQLQRATAAELNESRSQVAALEQELSQHRDFVATVRAQLDAVMQTIDRR